MNIPSVVASIIIGGGLGIGTAIMSPMSVQDPVPHCQPLQIVEPARTFNVTVCNAGLSIPPDDKEHQWIVDGSNLKNGAIIFGFLIPDNQRGNK